MKAETIGGKILATTIVVCSLLTGTASGEMNTYTFDPNQSTVVRSFLTSDTYTLTGAFQLTVDANSGSFDWVDARFSDDPNLQTGDLRELFYMDELVGDVVNDTTIEFELPPGHSVRQSFDIHITVTLQNGQVHLAGYRNPLMVGEPGYTLDAVANLTARIYYVDADGPQFGDGTSWATAFRYLQDALLNAVPPTEIRVAQGIYKPYMNSYSASPPSRTDTFQLKSGVTIKGGYAGLGQPEPNARDISLYETILSGDMNGDDEPNFINNSDNSYHVVTGYQSDCVDETTEVLDGFTIIGGNADGMNSSAYGGGMYYNCFAAVVNCTFTGNSATYGGGVYCGPSGCCATNPTFTNCTFIGNSAGEEGGAVWVGDNNPTMTNCKIIANSAGRRGGGMMFGNDNRTTMLSCLFNGNSAGEDGGGIYGIFCFGWTGTNCTFSNNSADNLGGGIFKGYDTSMTLTNCIFWGNSDSNGADESAQIHVYDGGESLLINFTCIQGWTGVFGGTSNIGNDPLFIDADGTDDVAGTEDDDLRLQRNSPCIDAGDNSVVPTSLLVDLDHKPRIANHIVDMGAYEKQSFSLSSNFLVVPEGGTAAFTVSLLNDPLKTIEVTVVHHSGDGDITVASGHNLFFDSSNYAKPQTVVLASAEDEDYLNGTAEIWISGPDLLAAVVIATEGENEPVPKILYVDGRATGANDGWSWNDAFTRLQDALAIAAEYPRVKEVRVAGGSYTPAEPFSGDREATFRIVKGMTMLGSYAGLGAPDPDARNLDAYTTVLSGDLNGNDGPDFAGYEENSYHVITCERNVGMIVVDGFEVRGGNAGFRHGCGINGYYAGPTVRNCKFIGNMANGAAAAKLGDAKVIDCTFIGNRSSSIAGAIGIGNSNGGTITRCMFIGNSAASSGGGAVQGSQLMVTDCTFIDNSAIDPLSIVSMGGALSCLQSTVINSVFIGNRAERGGAVFTIGGTVIGCTFNENSGQGGALYGNSITMVNSIFWNNNAGGGPQIGFDDSGLTSSVSFCDVQGGGQGIYVEDQPPEFQWGPGNIDSDPRFVDPDGGDNIIGTEDDNLRLSPDSPCINKGDNTAVPPTVLTDLDGYPRIVSGTVDMGANEFQGIQTLYVDADAPIGGDGKSWATAFKYLQDALFNSISPTEIRVSQGIYKPHLNSYSAQPPSRSDTFQLKNGVSIKGGYAGLGEPDPDARDISLYETILSGDMSGDDEPNFANRSDNSRHVVTGNSTDATAILDGFTITGGFADGSDGPWPLVNNGAGMYTEDGGPTVTNCTFRGNSAEIHDYEYGGYGAGMYNLRGSPTVKNCTFTGNTTDHQGGGMYNEHSSPNVTGCVFSNNKGGGMTFASGSHGVITGCSFVDNSAGYGAGINCEFSSSPAISDCTFTGNVAQYDGGGLRCYDNCSPEVSNCTFTDNKAIIQEGGGMISRGGNPNLRSCMFSENLAVRGGAICISGEFNGTFTGGVFENNTATMSGGTIFHNGFGELKITRCEFRGGSAERGGAIYNISASLVLSECILVSNQAEYAGAIESEGNITLTNCLLANNHAQVWGGALANMINTSRSVNCTFAGNSANYGGAIFSNIECDTIVINSIFWGNTAQTGSQIATSGSHGSSTLTVNYCDIENGTGGLEVPDGCTLLWGDGNIDAVPCFVDPDGADNVFGTEDDNLRLSFGSPCVDTGDPSYIAEPNETDLDVNPRVIGGRIDMGAYEFCGPVYVDDDGPNDPGPGDPQVSDPLENGTEDHPFDTIQEAVDLAVDGYTILVRQGSYFELTSGNSIDFLGKNITLTSSDPTDWGIVDNTVIRGYVQFSGTEDPNCKFTGFKISNLEGAIYGNHTHATISYCNISGNGACGVTVIKDCDGTINNCLITDNTTFALCGIYPVVFGCNGLIKNCTIANNESGLSVGTATIENCIIYNNYGPQLGVGESETLNISYCNLQGGLESITGGGIVNWGPGNIDTDPCFVRLGYWITDEITLVEGDYHLRSEGWRWNTEGKSWTYDFVTSRCVDAGNPGFVLRGELMSVPRDPDNVWGINLRINMGAFGGTSQASMPPHDWALLADLNNDGIVNFLDFAYQAQDWLITTPEQPGDLDRDGLVNKMDIALLAQKWLRVTVWCEW